MHGYSSSLSQRAFRECGERNYNISKYFLFTNTKETENGNQNGNHLSLPQQTNENIELNTYLKVCDFVDFKILSPIPV